MTELTGTANLARLILRRDRWLLPLWIAMVASYPLLNVSATESLNPTADDRAEYVASLATNSGFLMLEGPVYGSSLGALATWRSGDVLWIIALVSLLTVIRHTRADEELGRRELLGATVVGRHAPLAAALTVTLSANLGVGLLTTVGLVAQGLPAVGSVALALKIVSVGWIFAALAALVAQLTESAATARGTAVAVLGTTFLVRAVADAGGSESAASWLAWLSPLGWAHQLRPFSGEQWWILGLVAAVVSTLIMLAVGLSARRDVGAGVLRPRLGPAAAPRWLRNPLALAWRLHRNLLIGWAIGLAVIGGVLSGTAKGAGDLFKNSQQVEDVFGRMAGQGSPSDLFLAAVMGMVGLLAAAYAIQATLRLRAEEVSLRAEAVLATTVTRLSLAGSHLVLSLLGPAVGLAAAGVVGGLVYGASVNDVAGQVPRVLAGALAQLPAVWVLSAITVALVGVLPRLAGGAWAALGVVLFIWLLGASLELSQGLLNISPFTHLPKLPGGELAVTPVVVLVGLSAVIVTMGLAGFRRRDVLRT